jgi:16S rRNA (guanine966-N2)-methyltransferase
VRVVAGRLGGRRLRAPRGRDTRPTSDRAREALFAMLEQPAPTGVSPLVGARVLDLFAGSGALAIEALSRGAAMATLVERDARAIEVIRANLAALELGADEARVVHATARAALRDASARGDAYDLVLLDPPYRDAPALGRELSLALPAVLAPDARVVAESDRRAPLELGLPVVRERRYGDTLIRIHAHGT